MSKKMQLRTIDHIALGVRDINKIIETWQKFFDVDAFTIYDLAVPGPGGNVVVYRHADGYLGNLKVQLLQIVKGGAPSDLPEGLAHISVLVDNLDDDVGTLKSQGAKVMMHNPGQVAFLDCGDPSGPYFELIQKGATFTVVK